jgi:hypothetical protein
MNHETETMQLWIDRCVDRELDDEQQRQLLTWCEEHPGAWRDLALAFVEAQAWGHAFKQWSSERTHQNATKIRRATMTRVTPWFWLSAALLVCTVSLVGYQMSQQSGPAHPVSSTGHTAESASPDAAQDSEPSTPKGKADAIYMLVDDEQRDGVRPVQIPLIDLAEIDSVRMVPNQSTHRDVWKQLQQSGHRVTHQRIWYPVGLDDGRQVVLPVDNYEVQLTGYQ